MALAGSIEETWFDSVAMFDSDCDEDYESVQDGMIFKTFSVNHKYVFIYLISYKMCICVVEYLDTCRWHIS